MRTITYDPIGIIHSPFTTLNETPLQPRVAKNVRGRIELFAEYHAALADLDKFSHIFLMYHFHLAGTPSMMVKPLHEDSFRGVFATRVTNRPNPIGISVVGLDAIDDDILHISSVDIVDGTPLLDIKPFIPSLDRVAGANIGWLAEKYDNR